LRKIYPELAKNPLKSKLDFYEFLVEKKPELIEALELIPQSEESAIQKSILKYYLGLEPGNSRIYPLSVACGKLNIYFAKGKEIKDRGIEEIIKIIRPAK